MRRNNNALSLNQKLNHILLMTPDIYFQNGLVKMEMNEFYDALIDFTRAIELDRNFALAYNNRGKAYFALDCVNEAIEDFKKALQLEPNNPLYLSNFGRLYISINQPEEARKYINKAQQIINHFTGCLQQISNGLGQDDIQEVELSIKLMENLTNINQVYNTKVKQLSQQKQITKYEEEQYQQIQKHDLESLNKIVNLQASNKKQQVIITNIQKRVNELEQKQQSQENYNWQINQQFQETNQRLENIEKCEVIYIEKKLKEFNKPQNLNKLVYYQSFCQHILVFFQVCLLLEQDYFKVNRDKGSNFLTKFLDYISGVAQATVSTTSFIAQGIIIALQIFDYGVKNYEKGVITERLLKILNIIRSRFGTFSEAEIEIQMAVFQKIEEITEEDLDISSFEYSDETKEIISNQVKNFQDAKNNYWQLGVFHYLIVLKYIEKESIKLASQNIRLRDIILDGMTMRSSKDKNIKSEINQVQLDSWWKCY